MLFGTLNDLKPSRECDLPIGPNEGDPYMRRWYMIPRNPEFNIYYHEILHDDDDRALHDHPWNSVSIMCKGRLREITPEGDRVVQAGDVVFRDPESAHRLELIDGESAETLFITGPRVREWGFHCPKGWVDWRDFTDPSDMGKVGRGCGEMA